MIDKRWVLLAVALRSTHPLPTLAVRGGEEEEG